MEESAAPRHNIGYASRVFVDEDMELYVSDALGVTGDDRKGSILSPIATILAFVVRGNNPDDQSHALQLGRQIGDTPAVFRKHAPGVGFLFDVW
jgi:hypothetical protein